MRDDDIVLSSVCVVPLESKPILLRSIDAGMRAALCKVGKFLIVWSIAASLWLVLWIAFASLGGWPSNDDPFYAKPLYFCSMLGEWKSVKQMGELTASALAHQAVGWLAVVGNSFSYRKLFLVCIAQQSFAIAAIYSTGRALGLSFGCAFLVASSLGLFPLYFGHAFTFMTDGPATAWGAVACCCSMLGIVRRSWPWLLLASCTIGWGFWIRQTNGLLLLAPLVAWTILVFSRPTDRRLSSPSYWLPLSALLLPAVGAFLLLESGWLIRSNASRFKDVSPAIDATYVKETVIGAYGAILLIGWFMLPWMLLATREARSRIQSQGAFQRQTCLAAALVTLFASAVPFAMTTGNACLTNSTGTFIQNAHFGPIFLSDMDEPGRWSQLGGVTWPLLFWKVLSMLAIVSSSLVAWWIAWTVCEFISQFVYQWRCDATINREQLAIAMGLLTSCLLAAVFLILYVQPHMDRYWLFVLAAMAVWWMSVVSLETTAAPELDSHWRFTPAASLWAGLCLMLNVGISTVFTHDMLAWNNVRWQYINSQLASGMAAESIDGGRDVNAWLRLDEDVNSMPRAGDTRPWWSGRALHSLAIGDRPGWHEIDRLPWSSWATGQTHHLLILERDLETDFR